MFKRIKKRFKMPKIRLPSLKIMDLMSTVAGIILIGIGLYMIYPPAMYIVIGGILAFPGRREAD